MSRVVCSSAFCVKSTTLFLVSSIRLFGLDSITLCPRLQSEMYNFQLKFLSSPSSHLDAAGSSPETEGKNKAVKN